MGKPFFTKKQKALMRERRKRKKQQQEQHEEDHENKEEGVADSSNSSNTDEVSSSISKKRTHDEELSASLGFTANTINDKLIQVIVPSSVPSTGKDAKKFRKDARRKLRAKGLLGNDDDTIKIDFVSEDGEKNDDDEHKSKKRKKTKNFPSIQELLQQQKQQKVIQKENERKEKKLSQIPDEYKNQYVALDCEMVGIGVDGKKSALARVSLVDWHGSVVLDTYVQVPTRVTDFRTHVSGITPKHISSLKNSNAMDVTKCREQVAKILSNKILVGHALSNDLKALLLQHPKHKIRDTAKYRPYQRYGNNKWRPRKLRDLVKEHLGNNNSGSDNNATTDYDGFQESSHDSVQDAKATMELFQLVHTQWEKEISNNNSSSK